MNNKTTRNSFLLLVTVAVWGAAFVAQTVGGQTIGAYSFNCVRCIIGVLVLIPVMKFLDKKDLSPRKPKTKEDYKLLIKGGICCGVALCISTNLQHSISGIKAWAQAFLSCSAWIPILYAGILSYGVGYTLQIIGQNGLNPTVASLIMSLEAVFSAVFGWLILGQKLNAKEMLGCCLIFAAIILAQLPVQRKAKLADEVMGRTGVSKKSKYFWKKILILTWMLSLFLGILAGPCAVDAKNQKEKKEYGVFLSIDSSQIKKLYGYRLVVIDTQYFSAKDIRTLHKKGVKVYTYLNVGSIENFRYYYKKYEYLTIGNYENWEEEKWVDVSNKDWQKFMGKLSKKLLKKGVDGFFIDNCDVYDYAKTKKNFKGLAKILKKIKRLGKGVMINGGDVFVTKYRKTYGSAKDIMTAVNQESVWSSIRFETGTFGKQPKDVRKYFSDYVQKCKKDRMEVYLLEYTKDKKLIRKIKQYCRKNKFHYYISDSIELD